jgi:hypothetical protein
MRRGDVSDQSERGGRSSCSGWMPETEGASVAIEDALGVSGMEI